MAPPRSLPLSQIKVGRRYRKAFGDLRSLADSIAEVGLLHPVVVSPSGRLIVGERREEQRWLTTASAKLKQIYEKRETGRPGNNAFYVFEAGNVYVQFLSPWEFLALIRHGLIVMAQKRQSNWTTF
jgi:hypothetical protein